MLAPTRINPKEQKKRAKIEARRAAAANRSMVNDFNARWLALKNDAIRHASLSDDWLVTVYTVGMYAMVGLKAIQNEGLGITEPEHIEALRTMRTALERVADLEALNYGLRCDLVDGIEIVEAVTEVLSLSALAKAWHFVDTGLREKTLTSRLVDQLIDELTAETV